MAAIINMAHGLDLRLVAEGVETQRRGGAVAADGLHGDARAYLHSRPLMPERLTEYLQHWRSSNRPQRRAVRHGGLLPLEQ